MDRIVQLCSSNLSPLVKSFLERFVDPHSSASHPLVVEIVTSGTFKRLLDIFEPLSLPFTPHQSTPSPTDFSFRGKHPVEVHKFIIHLIINILTMWQNPSLSNFNPTFFQPSPHYGAMTVTLKLTQEYLRRVCETSKLVTHVFEESEIFGVLGNILLAAQHVDEAYSLLCELPILQAAMIFFDAFLKPFHVSHFLDDLERLFQPSYSALPARPDRIGIVRRMVMEEGWSDKTEQMLDYIPLRLSSQCVNFIGEGSTVVETCSTSLLLFDLANSTLSLSHIILRMNANARLTEIDVRSSFTMSHSTIILEVSMKPIIFSSGGSVSIVNVEIIAPTMTSVLSPFVSSCNMHTDIVLSGISFSNGNLEMDAPFLTEGHSRSLSLSSSTFTNISSSLLRKQINTSSDAAQELTSAVIVGTECDRADTCYTGALFNTDRIRSLSVANSSFTRATLTSNGPTPLTESKSYTSTTFADLSNEGGSGGALILNGDSDTATLTLTRCRFLRCASPSDKEGGAILAQKGKLVIDVTSFDSCSAGSGGAIATHYATLSIVDSSFTSCTATCQKWEDFSSSSYNSNPDAPSEERVNGGGGALWLDFKADYYLVSNTLFKKCSAPSFGGGVVFWPYECTSPSYFRMVNLMFVGTTILFDENDKSGGANIMITTQQFADTYQTQDYFSQNNILDGTKRLDSTFTNYVKGNNSCFAIHNQKSGFIHGTQVEITDNDVYVATTGTNVWNCGASSLKCQTVTYGSNKVTDTRTVYVAAGSFPVIVDDEKCVLVDERTVTIVGAGTTSTTATFSQPSFWETANFKLSSGHLSVTTMTLILTAGSENGWHLIDVDGTGHVVLTSCALQGTGNEQNGRLVTIQAGSLTATGCSFSNILSNLPTGSGIFADLSSTSSFTLKTSSFTKCKLGEEEGCFGAAVSISLQANADSSNYNLKTLAFSENSAPRAADIFISAADLTESLSALTKDCFIAEWNNNAVDNLRFRCESRGGEYGTTELGIPRYFEGPPKIFLNSTRADVGGCGTEADPCCSLGYAAQEVGGGDLNDHVVFVDGAGILNGTVVVSGCEFKAKTSSGQATLQVSLASSLTCTTSVSFSKIDFSFSSSVESSNALISATGGKVVFSSCSFKSGTGSLLAVQPLVSMVEGSLTADQLEMTNLKFSSQAITLKSKTISVGSMNIVNCEATETLSSPLVSLELIASEASKLGLGSISFSSFVGSGVVVEVKAPSSTKFETTGTLFSSSSNSITTNTDLSFAGSCDAASLLVALRVCASSLTHSGSTIQFPPSCDVRSFDSFVKTDSASLSLTDSLIVLSNLSGFYSTALFCVTAHDLTITQSSLSPILDGDTVLTNPFVKVTGGHFVVTNVLMEGSLFVADFSSSVIVQNGGIVDISSCDFTSIISSGSGSVVSSKLETDSSLTLDAVNCVLCKSTEQSTSGGALSVSIVDGTFEVKSGTSFEKCSSSGNGGALFIDLTERTTGSFLLNNIVYGSGEDANSCTGSGKGTDLFIAVKKGDLAVINSESLIGTYYSTPASEATTFSSLELSKYEFSETEGVSGSILYLFNGYSGGELVVDSSLGFEHSLCGNAKLPCVSLQTGFALLKGEKAVVVMKSGSDVSTAIESNSSATIKSDENTKQTVSLVSDVSITVSKDNLNIALSSSFFVVSEGSLSVSNCEFTSISSTAGGSAISATLTSGAALSISSTDFVGCSSTNGNGGAVSVSIVDGTLTIESTVSFEKCSSSGNGGALFIDLTERSTGTFTLDSIVYGSGEDANSCTGSGKGTDLFIAVKKGDLEVINSTSVIGTYFGTPASEATTFSSSELSKYEFSETEGVCGSILYLFNGYSGGELVVDSSLGFEHSLCGNAKLPCVSLQTGFALLKGEKAVVVMKSGSDVSTAIESNRSATIKSEIITKQTVTLVSDVSITVSQDDLTVDNLLFTISGTPRTCSFFVVSGGSLSVSNCEFTSISSTADGSAISATLASSTALSISSTIFVGCSSTAGNGGALHVTLSGGSFAILSSCTFKSCSSSDAGGAIFVGSSSDSDLSFNIANAVFGVLAGDKNECGGGKSGNDVFIKAGDLSSFKKKELFPSKYSAATIDNTLVDSIRLSSSHTPQVLSLLQYLYSPLASGLVSDVDAVSSDVAQCGFLELHCKTLNQLVENAKALTTATINTSLTISETFAPTSTLVITSISESRSSLVLAVSPSLSVNSENIQLTLTRLSISSKSSTSNSETDLVVVPNGLLIVSDSSFTTQTTLPSALVSISKGGSLQVTDLDVSSAQLTNSPLFKTEGSGSINIQSSSFASITRDDSGSGTVLLSHLALFSSFVFHHITITNCGTAILLNMEGCARSTPYLITEVSFTTNTANQLVVIGSDLSTLINKDKWTGSFESLAHSSNVLFSSDTRLSLSVTLLVYLIEQEGDVVLSGSGPSWDVCGSSASPCSTLERGLFRAQCGHDCRCTDSVPLGQRDVVIEKAMKVEGVGVSSSSLVFNTAQILFCRSPVNSASSSITFTFLTFQIPAQTTESVGFVVVERGFVTITECAVSCGAIATSALVCTNPASTLIVDKGTFANIVSSASGPAFSSTLQTDMTVHVTSTVFDGCQSAADGGALAVRVETGELLIANCVFRRCGSSGDGGGIWLNLEDLRETSQFSLTDTTFGVDSLSNSAEGSGDCVFVVGKQLKRVIVPLRWKGSFEQSAPTDLMGWDETKGTISLLSLFLESRIVVSSVGSDSGDGTDLSPFETMWRCMEETKGKSGPFQVVVVGKSGMGGSSWMRDWASWEMDVSGMEEGSVLECWVDEETRSDGRGTERAEGMMTLGSQTLTINEMVLLLKTTRRTISAVFVLLDSSRLVLESCLLKTETEIRYSLICGCGESHAELLGMKGEGVSFAGKGGIVKIWGSSSVVLTDCSFSSTSFWEGGVVWGSTCGGVWIRNSKFVKCSGKAFGSLVRVRAVGCPVSVSACNFTSCVTSVWFGSVCGEGGVVGGGNYVIHFLRVIREILHSNIIGLPSVRVMGGSRQAAMVTLWTPEMELCSRKRYTKLLRRTYLPALHAFFERFDSNAEFSETELKETENLFFHLSACVDRSSESPDVVTSAIFREDLFSMDRIVQLCSSNHHSLAKSFLWSFARPSSPSFHPLVVEIVTSGSFKRLLDIFEPLSLPFTPHQSTPSPTDSSFRGQHPDAVHKFILNAIIIVLKRWSKHTRSPFDIHFFQPLRNYDAIDVTLKLTREYLRRVCQNAALVAPVCKDFGILGVLGNILLVAPHVDEAYSLLRELPILQAAMIFFETFATLLHKFDFLGYLKRLFKPSHSVGAALPDRIAVVRGMVLEEGWSDRTEQILADTRFEWTNYHLTKVNKLFEAFGANIVPREPRKSRQHPSFFSSNIHHPFLFV
ncbi:hypothetical protein BLNAU_4092 [Blattamonas nauphoetae]|uniref:Uncharacterized protein n=1 Tax=Blattamonas nauphoetae TaxID=2049346 RepID=A0ABQ9YBA6_9EUKA|nr:hypothetical protein BLNAU_4092 [Blattamonas nauphoetae]